MKILACCSLIFAGAVMRPLSAQDVRQEAPVEMPTYTVTESRDLPPPEKWNYARIDGFEVLSSASPRETKRLVQDFQRFSQAIGFVWPGVQKPAAVPAALVICGRGSKFEKFMPAGEQRPDRAMASLSLHDREQSAIVIDFETKVMNLVTPEGLAAAGTMTTDADGNTSFGTDAGFEVDAYRQLYREYIRFLLSGVQPRPPAWLEEGLAQIFMAMEITDRQILVGKVDDPNEISAMQAVMNASGSGETAPQEDGTFNAALQHRALLPMEEMFAVPSDSPVAQNPLGSTWAKQCYAFVHWGLYGVDGKNQTAFLTFVQRLGREPLSETLFKQCFKKSYKEMGLVLRGYVDFTNHKVAGIKAKKGQKIPEPPAFELRDATQAEIGRILGDTLRLAGHADSAHLAMIAPYIRGESDPALLAALGLLERQLGDTSRARKFLEAASAGKAVRPRAYLELARLRLADGRAQPAAAGQLSSAQTVAVLTPLFVARAQPPPLPEVYEAIGDAWSACSVTPGAPHLAVLDEGVRLFPRDTALIYQDATLKIRAGLGESAGALINLGQRVAPDSATRDKFEALKARLPAPTPPSAPASPQTPGSSAPASGESAAKK